MSATGGKLTLRRTSERGVASIARDQEGDDIGQQELPNDGPRTIRWLHTDER